MVDVTGRASKEAQSLVEVIMRVWVYAYKAGGVSGDGRQAVEEQLDRLRRYARDHRWAIVGETFDLKPSPAGQPRRGLAHVIEAATSSADKFDLLLVTTMSRIGRNIAVVSLIEEKLRAAGVAVQALDGSKAPASLHLPNTNHLLGYVSSSARKVARARQQLVEAGHWPGGRPNFGYRLVRGVNGRCTLAVDPNEARVVRYAFQLTIRHGPLLHRVANILNDRGYTTRHGRAWSAVAVDRMLQNQIYRGYLRFRVPLEVNNVEKSITGIGVSVPSIVERKLFFEVQRLLRRSRPSSTPTSRFIGKRAR